MVLFLIASLAAADTCSAYGPPETIATLKNSPVKESSGVVQSRSRNGVWFTHQDKGHDPSIFAFDLDGNFIEEHEVKNADNFDWEDIAAGPCPRGNDECLYIGDIGDNDEDRGGIIVYVVPEPKEGKSTRAIERWTGVYPEEPQDAEALMVHPCTGRVHVVTKDDDGESRIYRFPSAPGKDTVELESVGTVFVDGAEASARQVTAGDFDADGDRVVIRTGNSIREWVIDPEKPNDHWLNPPIEIEGAAEFQGEGIAYSDNGDLITTSEGNPMTISRVPCVETVRAQHECVYESQGCGCASSSAPVAGWLILPLLGLFRRRS